MSNNILGTLGLLAGLTSATVTVACDSPDGSGDPTEQPGSGAGGSGGEPNNPGTEPGTEPDVEACTGAACLEPPAEGFQLRSTPVTIAAGQDVEYCEVVRVPGEAGQTYYINKYEGALAEGSHHLILEAAVPGTQTEAKMAAVEGMRTTCVGPVGYGRETVSIGGQQSTYRVDALPEGVGQIYRAGQMIVLNYHYVNTTDAEIEARATVNFYAVDPDSVQRLADSFAFLNFGIETPPGQTMTFSTDCRMSIDVMVSKVIRHTHQWGTDFNVYFAGGARDGELIFSSSHYEDTDYEFAEPVEIRAGEGFAFDCTFVNTEAYPLRYGFTGSDEMCNLFGTWWPVADIANPPKQNCIRL
jgi:hypothetical protein